MSETLKWLLGGDPAVRWQVQRDLLDRAPSTWKATRREVAKKGWGAFKGRRTEPGRSMPLDPTRVCGSEE